VSSAPSDASPAEAPALSPASKLAELPPANDPHAHTEAFFDALLAYAPEDHHSLLWTLPDKKSTWVPLNHGISGYPDCPVDRARLLTDAGKDVYVAVSVAKASGLHDTRITSANAAGIFGLWADIDIADPDVHKKWNLPPTLDAALEVLDAVGAEPTLVVHSGHGLQAWWLFTDFWEFGTEDVRLEAAGLAERWNRTLQQRAGERHWIIDSTYDLARVMRVPGTLNRKGTPVMPVRLIRAGGPRYTPDQLDGYVVDENFLASRGITPTSTYQTDPDLVLSEANKVDLERLEALLDNDEVFKASYDRKRKDMSDQSASSYDLSLATLSARAGWSDQEIATLLYQFRKRHKLDPAKALRRDYIDRTIGKARGDLAREDASEAIEDVEAKMVEAKQSGDDELIRETRRGGLSVLTSQLEVECVHFIQYASEPAAYALVTPTKTVMLGGTDGILTWSKLKATIWETLGIQIPRFKTPEWDRITKLIPKVWEIQDVGAEATQRGEVASWLSAYLSQRPPVDTVAEAVASEYPFVDGQGRVCLFGQALRRWLYLTYQERVTPKQLGVRLKAFGCEPDKVTVDVHGKRTSKATWRLPSNVEA
jgi:hypothetical protein